MAQAQYKDDEKLIADMLKNQWSLGDAHKMNIEQGVEQQAVSARIGNIFVQRINRSNQIASIDYQTMTRTSNLAIKVSNRFRDEHFLWCDEVYRILLANRRRGEKCLDGWLYLEVLSDRSMTDLSGWQTTTFDIRLTTYNAPIDSLGLGNTLNNTVTDSTSS